MGAALCEVGKVWPVTQSGCTILCSRHSDNHETEVKWRKRTSESSSSIVNWLCNCLCGIIKKKNQTLAWTLRSSDVIHRLICHLYRDFYQWKLCRDWQISTHLSSVLGNFVFRQLLHLSLWNIWCFFVLVTVQNKYVHHLLLTTAWPHRNQWLIHQAFQYWCGCVIWTSRGQPRTGNTQQQRKSV